MTTLLVLGSKPDPIIPAAEEFDGVACANGSGHSAHRHGLPTPRFTVMSAILTSGGRPANRLALEAMRGLRTGTLYLYPRPRLGGSLGRRLHGHLTRYRIMPWYVRRRLKALDYRYEDFRGPGLRYYLDLLRTVCNADPEIMRVVESKRPSTGIIALALGLGEYRYARCILAGFSFEITHAYAHNPRIAERGTASRHADTDIAVLSHLARRTGAIFTTEPAVHERAAVPLLRERALSPA